MHSLRSNVSGFNVFILIKKDQLILHIYWFLMKLSKT